MSDTSPMDAESAWFRIQAVEALYRAAVTAHGAQFVEEVRGLVQTVVASAPVESHDGAATIIAAHRVRDATEVRVSTSRANGVVFAGRVVVTLAELGCDRRRAIRLAWSVASTVDHHSLSPRGLVTGRGITVLYDTWRRRRAAVDIWGSAVTPAA